jgi:hypothetical protein
MSHRNDLIRLYNHDSCGSYVSASSDGQTVLVQLFRYAGRRGDGAMTLTVSGKYKTARFHNLDGAQPTAITPVATRAGVDIPLPNFSVYAAVELGK